MIKLSFDCREKEQKNTLLGLKKIIDSRWSVAFFKFGEKSSRVLKIENAITKGKSAFEIEISKGEAHCLYNFLKYGCDSLPTTQFGMIIPRADLTEWEADAITDLKKKLFSDESVRDDSDSAESNALL